MCLGLKVIKLESEDLIRTNKKSYGLYQMPREYEFVAWTWVVSTLVNELTWFWIDSKSDSPGGTEKLFLILFFTGRILSSIVDHTLENIF